LQGVNFEWVNPEEHGGDYSLQGGFIAQDVEKMFPGWIKKTEVTGADKNLIPGQALSVSLPFEYDALVVEAIKEQQRQIAGQQQQIREQQKQIDELRAQMEKILSDR